MALELDDPGTPEDELRRDGEWIPTRRILAP